MNQHKLAYHVDKNNFEMEMLRHNVSRWFWWWGDLS